MFAFLIIAAPAAVVGTGVPAESIGFGKQSDTYPGLPERIASSSSSSTTRSPRKSEEATAAAAAGMRADEGRAVVTEHDLGEGAAEVCAACW
jgi:hypothetical protein